MLSLTSRGLRLSFGTLLVLGALALAPTNANAQWSNETCIDMGDIPLMFGDTFTGLDNCESLCKKSADYCVKFVKDAASCTQTNYKGFYYFIDKTECDTAETSEDRKLCKQQIKGYKSGIKQEIDGLKDELVDDCKDYEASCIQDCTLIE